MANLAEFYITDGVSRINFLNGPFWLRDWRPTTAEYKDGGIFVDSPLADNRRPVFTSVQNASERIDLSLYADDVDDIETYLNNLKILVAKAVDYWKSRGKSGRMVYLAKRHSGSRQTKYTEVYFGRLAGRSNPFAQPFIQACRNRFEAELSLLLEHGLWHDDIPGIASPIKIGATTVIANAVKDASFEGGVLSDNWTDIGGPTTTDISPARKVTGIYSCYISSTTNGGVYQDITGLEAGEDVVVIVHAAAITGDIKLTVYDGGGTANGVSEDYATANPTLEQLTEGDFETNEGYNDWQYVRASGPTTVQKHGGSYAAFLYGPVNNNVSEFGTMRSLAQPYSVWDIYISGWYRVTDISTGYLGSYPMSPRVRVKWWDRPSYFTGIPTLISVDEHSLDISTEDTWIEFGRRFIKPSGAYAFTVELVWPWDTSVASPPSGRSTIRYTGTVYFDDMSVTLVKEDNPFAELSVTKTVPAGGSVRVALLSDAVGSAGYFDDVELQVETAQPAGSELAPISNAHINGRISHVVVADGAVFGNNLVYQSAPLSLLPATVAQNDALYIGSCDPGGPIPFGSVVFNLIEGTASGYDITWEYYATGPTWNTLPVGDGTAQLTKTGVTGVAWKIPTDWLLGSPDAALPSGYWIRARVSSAPSATAPPRQQISAPYMPNIPYIDISEDFITGDAPPLINLILNFGAGIQDDTETFDGGQRGELDGDQDTGLGAYDNTVATSGCGGGGTPTNTLVAFENVTIPKGATISAATITATSAGASGTGAPGTNMEIRGLLGNNDPLIESPIAGQTTANVAWSENPWTDLTEYTTPDLATVVQEIVNDDGWESGGGMGFIFRGDSVSGSGQYDFYNYDSAAVNYDPWTLSITYEAMGQVSTIIIGSRDTDRGADFDAYIPFSGNHISNQVFFKNIRNCSVVDTIATGPGYPTSLGKYVLFTYSGISASTILDRFSVTISGDLAENYAGTFRAYARVILKGTPTNSETLMVLRTSAAGYTYDSDAAVVPHISDIPLAIDLGDVRIPDVEQLGDITFTIAFTDTTPYNMELLDLVLMPKDELAAQFTSPDPTSVNDGGLTIDNSLEINGTSIRNPGIVARLADRASGKDLARYASSINQTKLPIGQTSRLWFMFLRDRGFSVATDAGKLQSSPNSFVIGQAAIMNRYT